MRVPAPIIFSAGAQHHAIVAQAAHATGLPVDLLDKAARRLAWVCFAYEFGFLAIFCIRWITEPGFGQRETFAVEAVIAGASVVLSLVISGLALSKRIRPDLIIDLGLVFEVLGGFGISMVEHWGIFGGGPMKTFGISWVCVWIVMFPLIVPSSPGKTLLAALLTANTGPIAYGLSVAFGKSVPQPYFILVGLFVPTYVCAAVAFLGARTVHKLGAQVQSAWKMGSYELIDLLGRGGMGEVWRARHRFLSRPAAIKLIRPETLTTSGGKLPDAQSRFEREAQATAALRSPHSIILYDFGVTQRGFFYYVMELLDGLDLQRLVERYGPMPVDRAVQVLRQVCHSLVDAHENGLIHRDIKPSNIFLCRYGHDLDFVKVLDFGLVKATRPLHDGDHSLTVEDTFVGTPAYMAPEVVYAGQAVDSRADLYSVGCLAFWLVTGRPVFEGKSSGDVLRQHVHDDPIPPSRCTELDLPAALDHVILSCLQKRPEARVATAASLLTMLDGLGTSWTPVDAMNWWEAHLPRESDPESRKRVDLERQTEQPEDVFKAETQVLRSRANEEDGRGP